MSFDIFLMLFISFLVPLLLLMLLRKKRRKDFNTGKLLLGPKKLPIIGNLHQMGIQNLWRFNVHATRIRANVNRVVSRYVAGTDTSSATVVWTMAELIRNPEVKERAQEEVRKVCRGKVRVEENDLKKLSYLKLVIKESWRLHPPAPLMLPRETIEKCTIDNKHEIPAKTRVIFNAAAIGTDPKYWESPEKFWPERFLNSEIEYRGQHFELLPFGAGRRGCPGINFAVSLVELALANLLFFFDWELPKGMLAEELDMEEALGIVVHKKIPLCLVPSPARV